jgi:uncharacterized protein (UPF0332 family)
MEWDKDLVEYRLARARQTLDDALVLAEAGRWNACVNRLYYACFYMELKNILKAAGIPANRLEEI